MKNYSEFMEYIKENVTDYLPERFEEAEISIQQVVKNNDVVLDGLSIRNPDSNLSPNIYLNPLYEQYQKGRNLDELVSSIADTYIENIAPLEERAIQMPLDDMFDYEQVKDNIFPRLVNLERNQLGLKDVPYTKLGDLAVTYRVKVSGDSNTLSSLAITNALMEKYGVTTGELHEQALENMERLLPAAFHSLDDIMTDIMAVELSKNEGISMEEAKDYIREMIPPNASQMYCLTNETKINGATCIINENVQKMVADKVGGDYFIIPSSVHEVLILPKSSDMSPQELESIVKGVNAAYVSPNEFLSDHVYQYDAKEHKLSFCTQERELKQNQLPKVNEQQEHSHEPIKHSGKSH